MTIRPAQKKQAKGVNNRNSENPSQDAAASSSSDPRFARFRTDPLYRLPSKRQTRVAVDSRFSRMFNDDAFTSRARVDRYGRKLPKQKGARGLERLYSVRDGKGKDVKEKLVVEAEKGKDKVEKPINGEDKGQEEGDEELSELSSGEGKEEEQDEEYSEDEDGGVSIASEGNFEREPKGFRAKAPGCDPARDGGFLESSSEEDTSGEDSEEEEAEEDIEESGLAANQVEDVPDGEVSRRLAVVNLDWDNIRAVDLMAVLKSFAGPGGRIDRVTVYPSEFGKERLRREETEGPPKELFKATKDSRREPVDEDDEETDSEPEEEDDDEEAEDERIRKAIVQEDEGEDFDSDQLRKYQLERLQYYYAVVECSTKGCAKGIYDTVDGTEYLSTANFFDLRFIPDETDFSTDKPRESCEMVPDGYKPNDFSTHALQHSKVKLTWDADDTGRKEAQKRAFSRAEIDENDLKAYLASDSSDEDYGNAIEQQPEIVDATEVTMQQADKTEASQVNQDETSNSRDAKLSKKEIARQRMRALLGLPAEPAAKSSQRDEPIGNMQITFTSGLSGGDKGGSVFENEPIDPNETTLERYVRKERERKARRKEKMKAARKVEAEGEEDEAEENDAGEGKSMDKDTEEAEDLGFDDPFFTEPATTQLVSNAKRKEEKRKKRAAKEAEEARTLAERAALEHLMVDESDGGEGVGDVGSGDEEEGEDDESRSSNKANGRGKIRHFDMSELKKAEKTLRKTKGSRKARLKAGEKAAIQAKQEDDFHMNVEDPRFIGRMDRPQFALDPSHPSYSGTQGMQELLEAKRRKRALEAEDEDFDRASMGSKTDNRTTKKRKGSGGDSHDGGGGGKRSRDQAEDQADELRKLVQRVKGSGSGSGKGKRK